MLFIFHLDQKNKNKSSSDGSVYVFPDSEIEACDKAMLCPSTPTNL